MTIDRNDRRNWVGALAIHSPFSIRAVLCVVCSRYVVNACEILHELCIDCFRKGWRAPQDDPPPEPTRTVIGW